MTKRIFIVGMGAFGTGLGQLGAVVGHDICLVGRSEADVAMVNEKHVNQRYLPDVDLNPHLRAQVGHDGIKDADLVLVAVPMQHMRDALGLLVPVLADQTPLLLCAKGLERGTAMRQSQIMADLRFKNPFAILSGPGFATDIAGLLPTAMTIAAPQLELAQSIGSMLRSKIFRPYASDDVTGLELCGAIKNIMAIGCGAVQGAGLGMSARAALFSRAFAELGRLMIALGGKSETLVGLAGLGDMTLTCTTQRSRNYRYGMALGQKSPGGDVHFDSDILVEGIYSAPVAQKLAQTAGVDAPIMDAINDLVRGDKTIQDVLAALMARPLKAESNQ